jgi:hypothetical protein
MFTAGAFIDLGLEFVIETFSGKLLNNGSSTTSGLFLLSLAIGVLALSKVAPLPVLFFCLLLNQVFSCY